jgi:FtsP/CotA-like multicopper oxidase with cupredoxin domain
MNKNRRNFLRRSAVVGTGLLTAKTVSAQHEQHMQPQPQSPKKSAPAQPQAPPKVDKVTNVPVITPDLPKLPWTMEDGVKVFHLSADVVKREFLPAAPWGPAKVVDVWGYNGSMPGPTIEVNEGDRVRIMFHNNLPEETTIHWHGLEIPIEMDGTPYISQPPVKPGGMFLYEFTLNQSGTFFYHSHGAMQEMMGQIGLFVIHPKNAYRPAVDKDFGLILQEWAVLPNNTVPNSMAMEFNWLTINGKAGPATTPMIVKQGERVRIRLVNLGMDHHPIHIHGHQFYVTGTEGGRIPESAWFPGNTVLVGVAQARDIEFDAIHAGDWMLHCHLPHHMMNQMISMVGPMAHVGHGMQTGAGMEEGMGIVREGHATAEHLGPAMGRGMGIATDRERAASAGIGGQHEHHGAGADQQAKKSVPGYPQDEMMMMMMMDEAVAKPENNGLAPGWTSMLQGMMSLIRVLPADKYEKLMADIKDGRVEKPRPEQEHKHNGE